MPRNQLAPSWSTSGDRPSSGFWSRTQTLANPTRVFLKQLRFAPPALPAFGTRFNFSRCWVTPFLAAAWSTPESPHRQTQRGSSQWCLRLAKYRASQIASHRPFLSRYLVSHHAPSKKHNIPVTHMLRRTIVLLCLNFTYAIARGLLGNGAGLLFLASYPAKSVKSTGTISRIQSI